MANKTQKKKHFRLRRRVRKTLGTVCLVTALLVAAIPVQDLEAADPGRPADANVSTDSTQTIPQIKSSDPLYTSEDNKFVFAYIASLSGGEPMAVIAKYIWEGHLENNLLAIPETVDAYAKYETNVGDSGNVAVGENGNFLFYRKPVMVEQKDTQGNITYVQNGYTYEPCYQNNQAEWLPYESKDVSQGGGLYHHKDPDKDHQRGVTIKDDTTTGSGDGTAKLAEGHFKRLSAARVAYISNQWVKKDDATNWWVLGGSVTKDNKDQGVFANQGQIATLNISKNLIGIGDYAFYHCNNISSVTLGNGLNTIGNGAFYNCGNMTSIDMGIANNLNEIGEYAFYGCANLDNFVLPNTVKAIGNSCFEGCGRMKTLDLCSSGTTGSLEKVGHDAFKDCSSLTYLVFPVSCDGTYPVYISAFAGCSSLKYIRAMSKSLVFKEETATNSSMVYGYKDFQSMDNSEYFYFEGIGSPTAADIKNYPFHNMARENYFAFSYINEAGVPQDRYEITVLEDGGGTATYEVNSSGVLQKCTTDGKVESVTIPNRIGPYGVNKIGSTTFNNNCYIKKVTIPKNVLEIAAGAFKGCHQLANVVFETDTVVIGTDAFKTQEVTNHQSQCPVELATSEAAKKALLTNADGSPTVQLKFSGTVSSTSTPFRYAMSEAGRYNSSTQSSAYITYLSGWPGNLEIQYLSGKPTLVNCPSLTTLKNYTAADYAYLTDEQAAAMQTALANKGTNMTELEAQALASALDIVIPEGVTAVADGLFKKLEDGDKALYSDLKTITAHSLEEINAQEDGGGAITGTFAGCEQIKSIELVGGTATIDDYAFDGCENLESVTIPSTLTSFGLRPFRGCTGLSSVSFQDHPDYGCSNYIVYGPDSSGNSKAKVLELLESRPSGVVNGAELSGVTELAEEAFMGTEVSNVDLRQTTVKIVPERAFAETPELNMLQLPYTCTTILNDAFDGSDLRYIEVPNATWNFATNAFDGLLQTDHSKVTFYCEPGSKAEEYALANGFSTAEKPVEIYYTVQFYVWDNTKGAYALAGEPQRVLGGNDAVPPTEYSREGYVFTGWSKPYTAISADETIYALYEPESENARKCKVVFKMPDGTEIETVYVDPGATVRAPGQDELEALAKNISSLNGKIFTGWQPALTNIQEDTVIWAIYADQPEDEFLVQYYDKDFNLHYQTTVKYGGATPNVAAPTVTGYTFKGWEPWVDTITEATKLFAKYTNGKDDGTEDTDPDEEKGTAKTYTLTVKNGSGSGSYVAGSQPIIIANDPASGMAFSSWTIDPDTTTIASKVLSATVITMPAANVTVTANYKTASGSGSGTGSGTGSGSGSGTGSGTTNTNKGNTTVVIDKNGLSNTGVVSAKVNGSSDNFTIKISESSAAAEAAVKALQAEYGDLNNIKYFPMDISLYDATGKTKIKDTSGLSISITLPLPDSLITYAGNNKVASIVNDRLEPLAVKFSTISGVSCVTFTAEHFSPYVIYVDAGNLTAGSTIDVSPKTGDGIHPKWFLSMGLACLSCVLFLQKEKTATPKKARVKARSAR